MVNTPTQEDSPENSIPGTCLFDGRAAMKGYALTKRCCSLNQAGNRVAFLNDEDAYRERHGLSLEQRKAVRRSIPAGRPPTNTQVV